MTVEELEGKVAQLEKELADKAKKLEGLDSLNGKRGTELGEIREKLKEAEELKASVKVLTDKLESATKEIESLKSNKPAATKETQPPSQAGSAKEQADRLEESLTDDERKKVEAFLEAMPEKERKSFVEDDSVRVAVFEGIKSGNGKVVPDGIWRVKKPASGEDVVSKMKKALEKFNQGKLVTDERGGDFGKPRKTDTKVHRFF